MNSIQHQYLQALQSGVVSNSPEETRQWARKVAQILPPVACLALYGDLGSGKTCFVQGLAANWGIHDVQSSSFALCSLYSGQRTLCHVDAYRLNNPQEYEALLLEDVLVPPYCLAIEWPERLGNTLPAGAWKVFFEEGRERAKGDLSPLGSPTDRRFLKMQGIL